MCRLMLFVAAATLASSAEAWPLPVVCTLQDPGTAEPFFGVAADQYAARTQPNLTIVGKYQTGLREAGVAVVDTRAAGSVLQLRVRVQPLHGSGHCQAFRKTIRAATGRFDKIQIRDSAGHSITVDVHVHR